VFRKNNSFETYPVCTYFDVPMARLYFLESVRFCWIYVDAQLYIYMRGPLFNAVYIPC
jgi:hypothetical protein